MLRSSFYNWVVWCEYCNVGYREDRSYRDESNFYRDYDDI